MGLCAFIHSSLQYRTRTWTLSAEKPHPLQDVHWSGQGCDWHRAQLSYASRDPCWAVGCGRGEKLSPNGPYRERTPASTLIVMLDGGYLVGMIGDTCD